VKRLQRCVRLSSRSALKCAFEREPRPVLHIVLPSRTTLLTSPLRFSSVSGLGSIDVPSKNPSVLNNPAKMSAYPCPRPPAGFTTSAPTKPDPVFEHHVKLCDCTAGPHLRYPCTRGSELEHTWWQLVRANEALERQVAEQYETIDRLHEQNAVLRHRIATKKEEYAREHDATLPDANARQTEAGASLRQIETEMQILDLSCRVSDMEARIVELQASLALLADEVADHEECITMLADVLAKAKHDASQAPIRGGMGGRDEDEEFVYGYGEYTNWDEMDEGESTGGSEAMLTTTHAAARRESVDEDMAQIVELRRQMERLEQQVQRLRGRSMESEVETTGFGDHQQAGEEMEEWDVESAENVHLRGGYGTSTSSSCQPVQPPSIPDRDDLATAFDNMHPPLLHTDTETCTQCPPSACTDAWTSFASMLQLRNCFLERELADYKELCESLLRDVRWQMGTQVELEEMAEAAEQERDAAVAQLCVCNARLQEMERQAPHASSLNASSSSSPLATPASSSSSASATTFPEPDTSHIPYTSFTYLPRQSLLLFPSDSPQLFRFADGSTLRLVHAALEYRRRYVGEDNPYLVRARAILDAICAMGIALPDGFEEDQVVIGIPDVASSEGVDAGVEIAAWRTAEGAWRLGRDEEDAADARFLAAAMQSQDARRETKSRSGSISTDGGRSMCNACFTPSRTHHPIEPSPCASSGPGPRTRHEHASEPTSNVPCVSLPTAADEQQHHPKDRGCEQWSPIHLNPSRSRCTFCHLPFRQDCVFPAASPSSNSPTDSIRHELDPPAPTAPGAYDDRGNKRFTPWWGKGEGGRAVMGSF